MNRFTKLFFLSTFLLSFSCTKTERKTTPAFYHWQTKMELTPFEINYLDSLKVATLYVKFFDVDWDFNLQDAFPQAVVQLDNYKGDFKIIPTVFITNRTLLQMERSQLPDLANQIVRKIESLAVSDIHEIQIDCDWSPKTKDHYFKLLELIRQALRLTSNEEKNDITLSATIRLHQVKYADITGIPPIDKGMLMFYNMGEVDQLETSNSILDLALAKQYLYNFENYPIPLDVALPLFSWAVLFREGEMIKLITNSTPEIIQDSSRFQKLDVTHFEVKRSTYLDGHYLYKGDQLRLESVTEQDLKACGALLKAHLKNEQLIVSFYHLDSTILNTFTYDFLEEVCHQFH